MEFHESYGLMPSSTLKVIKSNNVSPADWDGMLDRWGIDWFDEDKPWDGIEHHITTHSESGSYRWPMYG